MQGPYLRKYGVEATIDFHLYQTTGTELKVDAAHAAGDTVIMKDEGPQASTTNAFTDEGTGYSIVLTATEMQAARILIHVVDQGTKTWIDTSIAIETYGNASAQHAVDLDDGVRAGLTALPNAAADAAGGLPISDAGGLDVDAIKTKTDSLTFTVAGDVDCNVQSWGGAAAPAMTGDAFARLGAPAGASVSADVAAIKAETATIVADTNELQVDWVNGGRLDLIVDAILADTNELQVDDYPATLTTLGTKIDTIDGIVDDVLVDTGTTLPATLTTLGTKIDTIDGIVDDVLVDTAVIGALGAGLTAVPWNAAWDAEVQSECTDALNAYDPPTKAELDTAVADVSVDEIQATALADLFNTGSGTNYAAAVAGSPVKEIADNASVTAVTAIQAKTDNLKDAWNDISVADLIAGIADGTFDLQEMLRIMFAVLSGKSSGGGTATITFRDAADSKNRVSATVDADGNRTAVTRNGD